MAAKSTKIIIQAIILNIYRAYFNAITVWSAQSLGIILACILECNNKTLKSPNGVASDPPRSFARFCATPRVVIQIRIDQLTKKFIFTLFLCRPKSIVGLPPRLSSFGIIFSERFFLVQNTSFRPIWSTLKFI